MSIILGIESTAHTFGIGVVRNGKILSNVRDMYTTKSGGIIPMEAAKHHALVSEDVLKRSLDEAKIKLEKIDAIAFSNAPGLAPCLIEGMKFTKKLAEKLGVSLVAVNHCVAHLEIGKSLGTKDPVMLYASGANTQVIAYESGKFRVFGETLDVGVGNFIDNFARFLGVGFPGGPKIEELALQGENYVELPYTVKGMDIALSGILTNLRQKVEKIGIKHSTPPPTTTLKNVKLKNKNSELYIDNPRRASPSKNINERATYTINDLAYSMQETVFAMLIETAERALAHTGKKELLLAGGVACNKRLQEMAKIMCKERGCKFYVPERSLLLDNGAMIAYLGEIMFKAGIKEKNLDKIDIKPRERTDDVLVKWKN